MKNAIVSLLLLLMVTQYVTAQKKVIKIACIGNSITYGVGTIIGLCKNSHYLCPKPLSTK